MLFSQPGRNYFFIILMGCLNNKVETSKNPKSIDQPIPVNQQLPKAVAFQIPNTEIKVKKSKAGRPNHQLYIIREVSNINQELVQSPLKQPQEVLQNVPEQLQSQLVQVYTRKRIKTSKELSAGSEKNEKSMGNKTANFIPDDETPDSNHQIAIKRLRQRAQQIRRRSDNRIQLNDHSELQDLDVRLRKKRKGSLNLDASQQQTYHSIHFKRAKTFHGEEQLVHPTKSLSINKGTSDAASAAPVFVKPTLGITDFEAEINNLAKNEAENNPKLLELYHGLSQEHEKNGRLEEALAANGKYLKLARILNGVDSCNYGAGLSNLSSIHYSLENYQKAIQNSMKAKSIRSYAAIDSHMHKARVLNEIGLIELQQNHLKEATHYLEEVKQIHAKVTKEFQLSLEDIASKLENSVSKDQYFDRSVQSMEVGLKVCLRVFGQNHLQTANHLDDLGTSYCDAGRYSESLDCFNRCLSIIRRMRLSKHKDYQTHTKHFFYNLEVIKLNPNCKPEIYAQAANILEAYFPTNELIGQFKSKMAVFLQ